MFEQQEQKKLLQNYLEILYKILGVIIDFVAADGSVFELYSQYQFSGYCAALRAATANSCHGCGHCDRENLQAAIETKQVQCYCCHAGMTELIVPLFDESGTYIGSITSGQFRRREQKNLTRAQVYEMAQKYNLPPEEIYDYYKKSVSLTQTQIEGLISYLETIGRLLAREYSHVVLMHSIDAPERIQAIKQYVEKNYQHSLSLTSVAKDFFLSPGYFAHMFRNEVGVPFNIYLNRFRILKAREMLIGTNLSITTIAYQCGFRSLSQFNRSFKTFAGTSPSAYREKHKK